MAYGKPFQIPRDAAKARKLADDAATAYGPRDQRMLDDQDDFELRDPAPGRPDPSAPDTQEDPVRLNDLKAAVEKAAAMIAARPPEINVASNTDQDDPSAQRIEDFLMYWNREVNQRHMQALHAPLLYDESLYLLLRGWLCGRLLLRPDAEDGFIWDWCLLDPMTVYPVMGAYGPRYVVHTSYPTKSEAVEEWGTKAEQVLENKKDTDTCCQTAFYTDREMGVLIEKEWVQPVHEHNYGFNPVITVAGRGAPYAGTKRMGRARPSRFYPGAGQYGRAEGLGGGDWTAYRGESFMATMRPAIEEKAKALAITKAFLEKSVYPPTYVQTNADIEAADLPTTAGTAVVLPTGSTVQPMPPPAQAMAAVSAVLGAFQDSANRASFGPAVFGGAMPTTSGYDRQVAGSNAQDPLYSFVEALRVYTQLRCRHVLTLFGRFGVQPVSFLSTTAQGIRTAANRLDPMEALGADVRVEVRFRSLLVQDRAANANMAAMLVREGLIDNDTARDEYLDIANPRAIGRKAIADQALKHPMRLQIMSITEELKRPDLDPMDRQILQMILQQMMQKFMQEMMQSMGLGGGQPGMGGPGMPPQGNPNMPQGVLPNQLGPQAGMPPGMEALGPPGSAAPGQPPPLDLIQAGGGMIY